MQITRIISFSHIMFSTLSKTELIMWETFKLLSAKVFNLEKSKILSFGKQLINNIID